MSATPEREQAPEDLIEDVRVWLSWVPPSHAKAASDSLSSLAAAVSRLEAERDRLEQELGGTRLSAGAVEREQAEALGLDPDALPPGEAARALRDLDENARQARAEGSVTRESALALIADANRWQKAYAEARDELATATERVADLDAKLGAATTMLAEAERIVPGVVTTAGRFAIGLNDRERAVAAEERERELTRAANDWRTACGIERQAATYLRQALAAARKDARAVAWGTEEEAQAALDRMRAERAREALAGGGRTPTGEPVRWKSPCLYPLADGRRCLECDTCQDLGGLGLSAEPVAEESEPPVSTYGQVAGAWGFPHVRGRCPSCGSKSLFLAVGGHVTCSMLRCADPCAADDLLTPATVSPPEPVSPGAAAVAEAGER